MNPSRTVQSLRSRAVLVPLANPVRTASGQVTHAPLVLIDLTTQDGVTGHAYVFTYTPLALGAVQALLENLSKVIEGQPCAPHDLQAMLEARFRLLGNTGLVTIALAGIDMAAWDNAARAARLPLAVLLGGTLRPVPAYFSQGMDGLARGVELAHECLAHGYRQMKIKIGYPTLEEDLAVIRAVQAALGDGVSLAVDFNQSLSVPEAMRRCAVLDTLGLAWIEEPTRQDDDAGHARLADTVRTPIMLGENWFGVHEMARSLSANACDLVMPDVMKMGGVTGWLAAAALAQAARRPMCSHLFHEISAHLLCVTPTAFRLEILGVADPVLATPLLVRDGMAHLRDEPGSGVAWDEAAVMRYAVT
jgi:mandelate racemase